MGVAKSKKVNESEDWRELRSKRPSNPYEKILLDMILRLKDEITPDNFPDIADDTDQWDETRSKELVREITAARKWLLSELRRFGLSAENRFLLCRTLYEKAAAEPSQAALRLLCYVFCDGGVLLNAASESCPLAEVAEDWSVIRKNAEELYAELSARKQMSVRFRNLLERLKEIRPVTPVSMSADMEQVSRIRRAYEQIFPLKGDFTRFSDNISALLQLADSNPHLAAVKPLFLYRVMTRHGTRMKNAPDLRLDFRALWKYQDYKIEDDNGKNQKAYAKYLALFKALYRLFASDETVDAPLCLYGFDHLSNLGEFYRACYPEKERTLPLSRSIEEFSLEMKRFTCFENDAGDNVMLKESGLPFMKLDALLWSQDPKIYLAMERTARYFKRNVAELTRRFLGAAPEQVRKLCAEILDRAALQDRYRPKDEEQTALFLAEINRWLMEAEDYYAEEYLIEACKLLTGERVEGGEIWHD